MNSCSREVEMKHKRHHGQWIDPYMTSYHRYVKAEIVSKKSNRSLKHALKYRSNYLITV